jgi:hypothetical protein
VRRIGISELPKALLLARIFYLPGRQLLTVSKEQDNQLTLGANDLRLLDHHGRQHKVGDKNDHQHSVSANPEHCNTLQVG